MKGLIFTEFLEMVEANFSAEVVDDIIDTAHLASGGAYTTVGTYAHTEILALVENLTLISQQSTDKLVKQFGNHLFKRFVQIYPTFFHNKHTAFDFLNSLENHIHVEVHKLYPDAELPSFDIRHQPNNKKLIMIYHSKRPFAKLAEGLLEGCLNHYNEQAEIKIIDHSHEHTTRVEFHITVSQ